MKNSNNKENSNERKEQNLWAKIVDFLVEHFCLSERKTYLVTLHQLLWHHVS
jgi:hypothetical protein